jgi:hypothetical protein
MENELQSREKERRLSPRLDAAAAALSRAGAGVKGPRSGNGTAVEGVAAVGRMESNVVSFSAPMDGESKGGLFVDEAKPKNDWGRAFLSEGFLGELKKLAKLVVAADGVVGDFS